MRVKKDKGMIFFKPKIAKYREEYITKKIKIRKLKKKNTTPEKKKKIPGS